MKYFENIEQYLDDELAPQEKVDFERQLAIDKDLQRALAEEKATRSTLYLMMTDKFRNRAIEEDSHQAKIVTMPQTRRLWQRWAIAAAMIGIVLTTIFYITNHKTVDYVALAEKHTYELPVPKVQSATSESQTSDNFYSAIKTGNFSHALAIYEQLPEGTKSETQIVIFKAYCLLKTKQFSAAQTAFSTLLNTPEVASDETLKASIEWYLLMARLGTHQNIREDLQKIANNTNHIYKAKAIELLHELK